MKARSYLEQQISTITDDYALAIASYALALSRSSDAATVFTKLNSDAIVKGKIFPYRLVYLVFAFRITITW